MPTLSKSFGVVSAAVVSLLLHPHHAGCLYSAAEVSNILNVAADVNGNASISAGINMSRLLCAFANYATDEYLLSYDQHFGRQGNYSVLYLRREVKAEQKGQPVLLLGRFFVRSRWHSSTMLYSGMWDWTRRQ